MKIPTVFLETFFQKEWVSIKFLGRSSETIECSELQTQKTSQLEARPAEVFYSVTFHLIW